MTAQQKLARIDRYQDMIAISRHLLFSSVIIACLAGLTVFFGDVTKYPGLFIVIGLIAALLVVITFLSSQEEYHYLRLRKSKTAFETYDHQEDDDEIIAFMSGLFHKHNITPLSDDPECIHIPLKKKHDFHPKPFITSIEIIRINNITLDLTPEEAAMLTLCICPKSGSWGLTFRPSITFLLKLKVLSAHERMEFLRKAKS